MTEVIYKVQSNQEIADSVYEMVLQGDTSAITAPGQFVNLQIEGLYLRRPISVCDCHEGSLTLIYKVVGKGTEKMSRFAPGAEVAALTGLGNGFNTGKSGGNPVLIGGGVGVPPLYFLCRKLRNEGKKVTVILGFNSKSDVFYEEKFQNLDADVRVTTVDGSYGEKGFVTDALADLDYTYFYTCGPEAMFRAIEKSVKTSGQYSFEERMGCGFGACMGCSCKTKYGNKRICKDGPVLEREEILW